MGKAMFLGNGLNLLTHNGLSWNNVIEELSVKLCLPQIILLSEYKPFTLIYEGMCVSFFRDGKCDDILLKQRVSDLLHDINHNSYHEKFMNLGIRHIITTNYDYSLEKSVFSAVNHQNVERETRYSIFRRTITRDTRVWHIHGEMSEPETIMLGHEQYSGQLQKMRHYLTAKKKPSPFMVGSVDFDSGNRHYSWLDVFLRDDIYILGFSLDYSEIELWWLLSFKAQCNAKFGLARGKTYYYYWSHKAESDRDRAKIQLLESLGVIVKKGFDIEYPAAYDNFFANFN